jgi:hypothetical protein
MLRDRFATRQRLRNVSGRHGRIALKFAAWSRAGRQDQLLPRMLARQFATALLQVIDVSGDGTDNDGQPVTEAGDEATTAGTAINGLPIVRDEPDIAAYYSQNVIGGEAAFVTIVRDSSSFHTAVLEKFVTEIAQVGAQSRSD